MRAIASLSTVIALSLPLVPHAQGIIWGDNYVPERYDTFSEADAGGGSVGEYYATPVAYFGQSFVATGRHPKSITLNLSNQPPSDVAPGPMPYRVLIAEITPPFTPGRILWESDTQVLPAEARAADYTLPIQGVNLKVGRMYAFIIDTGSDRDGVPDLLGVALNTGREVAPYLAGSSWYQGFYGRGREADFAYPWNVYSPNLDLGFLIRYRN
jgi:hypothetical protein